MRSNWTDSDANVDNHYRSIHRDSHGYDPLEGPYCYDDLDEILYEDGDPIEEDMGIELEGING